jgi:membrane protease YdiL (CAAX protease family)
MAHYATRRFNYWGQLGVLAAFCGGGLIVGGLASFIPLLGKIDIFSLKGDASDIMDKILKPENANALRWSQIITTVFLFFIPAVLYAKVCHMKPFVHLGFTNELEQKTDPKIFITQTVIVVLIMIVSLPAVAVLQQLTEMLPWSPGALARFKHAEEAYNKQVAVIARMDNFADYLFSIIVIGLLPAMFEETLFRGGLQNLFSRWFKMPLLAIVITSIIFSAVHGSYLGFLSRFGLGFVLGWVYYRTGNIWLSIIAHFFNNAAAVTSLYMSTKPGEKIDPSKMEEHFPLWFGLASLVAVAGLFIAFEKISKKNIDRPGEEVLMPDYIFSDNPFADNINAGDPGHQQ